MNTARNQMKITGGTRFTKYDDIRKVLQAQTEAAAIEGLTALRNQLTIKHSEGAVAAGDERLLLVKSWLDVDNAARGVFDLWGQVNTRQVGLTALIVSVLSSLITLLSSQYTYHHLATPIIKELFLPQWSSKLNSYLSTSHNELLLVTLKLYNSLSTFAGGKEARNVLDTFPWELKTLHKLLNMRRRSQTNQQADILAKPDIRTLYVLFLLSFVDSGIPAAVKTAFLEQRRDQFVAIFKGLWQDAYSIVRRVLEVCWSGIWADVKVKRTVKINIFAENTISQITRLYERNEAEGESAESNPADLAHHFLLAICTRPGTGVCFQDQGWYPRDDENDEGQDVTDNVPRRNHGRVYNKILANMLKTLKVNEDARQQELALRILQACPELVAGYWSAAALTLEPRLSSKWIANIAFFGSAISLPVPQASFLLPDGSNLYRPYPPSLSTIMENILPSVNIKSHLSRGLQSSSALVQHCTALALAKSLTKLGAVLESMLNVQKALEEDEEDGLWSARRREVERETIRRIPDFQVIVAFAQQKNAQVPPAVDGETENTGPLARSALLSESAQRLLWLYHRHLPQLVAEARFDATRLLASIQEGVSDGEAISGLATLRQLHTLRLLNESEEFSIIGKAGSSRSALNTLLTLYTGTITHPIKLAVSTLLRRSLSQTLVFQHDPDEVALWLRSIPRSKRAPDAKAPDGTLLCDEATAVVLLLEDCILRCAKTPYRYLQELQDLWSQCSPESLSNSTQEPLSLPSPLLMAFLEQLEAKFSRNLLSPSDCLATVTYIRKVVLQLASKVSALLPLHHFAKRLEVLLDKPGPSSVMAAINREAQYLSSGLKQLERPTVAPDEHSTTADAFLKQIRTEEFSTLSERRARAYQLVDWYRLEKDPLDRVQFSALAQAIQQLDTATIEDLIEYATLERGLVWHYVRMADHPERFDFAVLFLHSSDDDTDDEVQQRILIDSIFFQHPSVKDLERAVGFIHHRLSSAHTAFQSKTYLSLLVRLLERASSECTSQFSEIARSIWRIPSIGAFACAALDPEILPVFKRLVLCSMRAVDVEGPLLGNCIDFWSTKLKGGISILDHDEVETVIMWLQAMDPPHLLSLLDHIYDVRTAHNNAPLIMEGIISALSQQLNVDDGSIGLASRLYQIQGIASLLPNSESAKQMLSIAIQTSLPLFYCGVFAQPKGSINLDSLVKVARNQWRAALDRHTQQMDVETLAQQEGSTQNIAMLSATMYKSASSRSTARSLLESDLSSWPLPDIARLLYAYLDTSLDAEDSLSDNEDILSTVYVRVVCAIDEMSITQDAQHICDALLSLLPRLSQSFIEKAVASQVEAKLEPSPLLFSVLADLSPSISDDTRKSVDKLTEHSSRWIVSTLSSDSTLPSQAHDVMSSIARTIKRFKSLSLPSAETLVMTAVQHRLQDPPTLSMVNDVLQTVELKPVTVNRILQTVLQHPKFEGSSRRIEVRSKLITVLYTLFYLHPRNTCQASHVEPLLPLYSGTMSEEDCKILSIFKLFERTKCTSIASLLVRWSSTPDTPSSTALEAVQSFDAGRMLRTCLQYPQRMTISEDLQPLAEGEHIYNPLFVILLFASMLSEGIPTSAPGWVQLFRTNVVGVLLRALSAHSEEIRDVALAQIHGLYAVIQDSDFQEKSHVMYILDLLRDVYVCNTAEEHAPRLPAYITLHLSHALRGIFYPSNFTYPLTARFLLQRPELDTNDMPLLYSMLYSTSDQWRKERAWIVRFMSDGMVGRQEWKVLRKRHVWDLLASMFHSEETDLHLRRSILELLANLTCERHAATSLVLGSALLSWIELQLERIKQDEGIAWVKILENILVTLDLEKLETATNGEWRSIISRCIIALLSSSGCNQTIFTCAVRVILRLSALSVSSSPQIEKLVSLSIKHLTALESTLEVPHSADGPYGNAPEVWSPVPHRSYALWKVIEGDELVVWGQCVEALWSATMKIGEGSTTWDALTTRLLVWRAYAGQKSIVGEWARREVIRNMRAD